METPPGPPPQTLVSLAEARHVVVGGCEPLGAVRWPLSVADGCVTAESIHATEAVPPFDNSAMDGYALRAADVSSASEDAPVSLDVVDTVLAGHVGTATITQGQCARVMTGAPLPPGADAVVPVERTSTLAWVPGAPTEAGVSLAAPVTVGDNVRRAGEDVVVGDVLVDAGTLLTPARLGMLAAAGRASVAVHPRPRVGVFTTGDELVGPAWPLAPGEIRDSNRTMLLATLAADGFAPVDLGHVRDDEAALTDAVRRGVATCDALMTTGGVSMGAVDLMRVVLERLGDMTWMSVAIKPAKPFAFGLVGRGSGSVARRGRQVPVFGLPGNPVSAAVSYELLARPGLRRLAGFAEADLVRAGEPAVVDGGLRRRPDGKVHYQRVVAARGPDGVLRVRSAGGQGSHQLSALAAANALAVLPDGDGAADGDVVDVLLTG
jgi:molybdopterin molybdotransferase